MLVEQSADSRRLIGDLKGLRAAQRQSSALALGAISYERCPASFEPAVQALLAQLDPKTKADVESRRNVIRSLSTLARQDQSGVGFSEFRSRSQQISTGARPHKADPNE